MVSPKHLQQIMFAVKCLVYIGLLVGAFLSVMNVIQEYIDEKTTIQHSKSDVTGKYIPTITLCLSMAGNESFAYGQDFKIKGGVNLIIKTIK